MQVWTPGHVTDWSSTLSVNFCKRKSKKERNLILPGDRDGFEPSVLGAVIPGGCTAAVSHSLFSLKLSTYSSCEASVPCPGETVHRQTNSTHIPVVLMSRSSGQHPQKESESSESWRSPPTSEGRMTRRTEKEGGKEAARGIKPGIDGAAPGTLWISQPRPAPLWPS